MQSNGYWPHVLNQAGSFTKAFFWFVYFCQISPLVWQFHVYIAVWLWPVCSHSMEATARKAQANITIDEQIAALHKAQGLVWVLNICDTKRQNWQNMPQNITVYD